MKKFCLLLSFLLLSFSVYPCSDNEECESKISTEVSEKSNHQKHNHESEHCPPFCSCACCGINVFQFQYSIYDFKKNLILYNQRGMIGFYNFIYTKKIADKIWQPPKIS